MACVSDYLLGNNSRLRISAQLLVVARCLVLGNSIVLTCHGFAVKTMLAAF